VYVRFVVAKQHPDTGVRMGIFEAVKLLPRVGRVADWDEARLDAIGDWFVAHLPQPTRVARSRRPNGHHAAVSWFKPTATEHIARSRELAAILDRHGIATEMLTAERPGYVVYEDEFQVVAEPFRGEHRDRGV
jgi:hypothetical protein